MKTKINQSEQIEENKLELKLTEIVFEDSIFHVKSTKKEVIPEPIGKPKILTRVQKVDSVTPYPYDRTIYSNPRFINSLEEDIEKICQSSANVYCLGDRMEIYNREAVHEKYAVQFYII